MSNVISKLLQALHPREPQVYKNFAVVPLVAATEGAFMYRTLGEALENSQVVITEVSNGGAVPELFLVNRGPSPVLLIDGEELAGAKQNRVLNTSVLAREGSEMKIPVSCTEQGRWAYASRAFSDSGNVMAHRTRSRKTSSVHYSLLASGSYNSDQGEVWNGIAELEAKAGTKSPTSAMKDVFAAREEDLRKCLEAFQALPNQVGLLVFIGTQLAGMDVVSLTSAYARLHPKLTRSYALEALLDARMHVPSESEIASAALQFMDRVMSAEIREFPSLGYGVDCRLSGEALVGAALVHEAEVIHGAFFRLEETSRSEGMAPVRTRRRFSSRE